MFIGQLAVLAFAKIDTILVARYAAFDLAALAIGCAVLLFPQPFLSLSRASPEVATTVRAHLTALAFALPPALLFTAFRGVNTAVSQPKVVMALQLATLLVKLPLTALLVFGVTWPTRGAWVGTGWKPAC